MAERELPHVPPAHINLRDIERELDRARQDGSWPRYTLGQILGRVYASGYRAGHLDGYSEAHDRGRAEQEAALAARSAPATREATDA